MREIDYDLVGDGTLDDPIRPDAFEDYPDERLHWDVESGILYLLDNS